MIHGNNHLNLGKIMEVRNFFQKMIDFVPKDDWFFLPCSELPSSFKKHGKKLVFDVQSIFKYIFTWIKWQSLNQHVSSLSKTKVKKIWITRKMTFFQPLKIVKLLIYSHVPSTIHLFLTNRIKKDLAVDVI